MYLIINALAGFPALEADCKETRRHSTCRKKLRPRWLESVEEDLKNVGVRNWRCKWQDGEEWKTISEQAKILMPEE
jgi:hypothetical protein